MASANRQNLLGRYDPFVHTYNADFVSVSFKETKKKADFTDAIKRLRDWQNQCKDKEKQFYADFGVADSKQWVEKYLITESIDKNENNIFAQASKIINSREMRKALYSRPKNQKYSEVELNSLRTEIEIAFGKHTFEAFKRALNKGTLLRFLDNRIIGTTKKTKAGLVQHEKLETISKQLGIEMTVDLNSNRSFQRGAKKGQIGILKKKIERKFQARTIKDAVDLLDRELENYINSMGKNKGELIKQKKAIMDEWEKVLNSQFTARKGDLFEINESVTTGGLDERGAEIIDTIKFQALTPENTVTSVISYGDKMIKRFTSKDKKQSNIDQKYVINNRTYNIQRKSSLSEIYDFLDFNSTDATINEIAQVHDKDLTIQGKIEYKNFIEGMLKANEYGGYNVFTKDMADVLGYYIANIEVHNKITENENARKSRRGQVYTGRTKFLKSGPDQTKSMKTIMKTVDKILSLNLESYVSDYFKEGTEDLLEGQADRVDFFIYKNRVLIPMSSIIEGVIKMINNQQDKISIHSHFSSSGVDQDGYDTMVANKIATNKYWDRSDGLYTQEAFVNVGKEYGKNVLSKTTINSSKLRIRLVDGGNLLKGF